VAKTGKSHEIQRIQKVFSKIFLSLRLRQPFAPLGVCGNFSVFHRYVLEKIVKCLEKTNTGFEHLRQILFMKNLAMAGGFLFLVAHGAGRISLDQRFGWK
jgi:hypothetical protein